MSSLYASHRINALGSSRGVSLISVLRWHSMFSLYFPLDNCNLRRERSIPLMSVLIILARRWCPRCPRQITDIWRNKGSCSWKDSDIPSSSVFVVIHSNSCTLNLEDMRSGICVYLRRQMNVETKATWNPIFAFPSSSIVGNDLVTVTYQLPIQPCSRDMPLNQGNPFAGMWILEPRVRWTPQVGNKYATVANRLLVPVSHIPLPTDSQTAKH